MSAPSHAFRLYVAGDAPNSQLARVNLANIATERLGQNFTIEEVDVLREPNRALADNILVTPTLILLRPGLPRRVVGNLSKREKVLAAIGL